MVLNRSRIVAQLALAAGSGLGVVLLALIPHEGLGLHPLALLASLLPLQLAALFWAFRGDGSRSPGSLPPASG